MSEYERALIVLKLRGAWNRQKARTGRCEGRKPYGHYAGEKRVMERMKALGAEGLAYDKPAERLTADGLTTRKGTAWHGFTVARILERNA